MPSPGMPLLDLIPGHLNFPPVLPMPVCAFPMPRPHAMPSPTEQALSRVYQDIPELRMHAPLGAIVTSNGPISDPTQGVEALRKAAAVELGKARRDFLDGKPLPTAIGPGGAPFTDHAVYTALAVDATAGEFGLLGEHGKGIGTSGVMENALQNTPRRAPPTESIDVSTLSPAYFNMFRGGQIATAVTNALNTDLSDLQHTSGLQITSYEGLPYVDFGIKRCANEQSSRNTKNSFFDTKDDWPLGSFITRHATVVNKNPFPVILVAVTQVPELKSTFRVRCDHNSLLRHPADRDLPGFTGTEDENDKSDPPGPVVLFPNASYEISVDFRADGQVDTPGHVSQWLLVATVECPRGWNIGAPFPARRDEKNEVDFVDQQDVKISGARLVAVVTKGSKERLKEVSAMLLNAETSKFVPRRLREAFDILPRAIIAPPTCLKGFEDRLKNPHDKRNLGFIETPNDLVPLVSAPAAYWSPNGVLVPRHFYRITQDGEREGNIPYTGGETDDDFQKDPPTFPAGDSQNENIKKFKRLLRVEENRQALDIRRYDLHDVLFQYAGKTERRVGDGTTQHVTQNSYDTYTVSVPGLLEGYPPVAPLDVLKLRCTAVGMGGNDRGSVFNPHLTHENVDVNKVVKADQNPVLTRHSRNQNSMHAPKFLGPEKGFSGKKAILHETDVNVPLDLNTEMCVTVWRVVPRRGVVVVAFPPAVSRTQQNQPRQWFKAHVRFSHDVSAFRTQRAALRNCLSNNSITAMLGNISLNNDDTNGHVTFLPVGFKGVGVKINIDRSDETIRHHSVPEVFLNSSVIFSKLKKRLNTEQLTVVTDVLSGNAAVCDGSKSLGPPYCCFGPPGTGKTVTNVAAALAVLLQDPDARLLLCAPAPFAADVVCSRLAQLSKEMFDIMRQERDPVLLNESESVSPLVPYRAFSNPADTDTWFMTRVNDPRRDPNTVKQDVLPFCADAHSDAVENSRVVVCTAMSAGLLVQDVGERGYSNYSSAIHENVTKQKFTHVFIDEAGQATVPETLVPLQLTNGNAKAVVLFGDPKQLGPVVHSVAARDLKQSLLANAIEAHENVLKGLNLESPKKPLRRLTKLTRNYRSHVDIFGLSSRLFYDDNLIAAAKDEDVSLPKSLVENSAYENTSTTTDTTTSSSQPARVMFVGCRGVQTRDGFGDAPSFFNALEAQAVVDLICNWLSTSENSKFSVGDDGTLNKSEKNNLDDGSLFLRAKDVGVIAPYRAQVVRLRTLLRSRGLGDIRVGTVDDYQGQEERVMFISTVTSRAPPKNKTTDATKDVLSKDSTPDTVDTNRTGFLSCPKRFNVAVTRAKALNVIVGHPVALEQWPHWKALLQHCVQRGAYVGEGADALTGKSLPNAGENANAGLPTGGVLTPSDQDVYESSSDYEALASAISRIARQSLLGGGDADELDFEQGTDFGEHQSWRVAL